MNSYAKASFEKKFSGTKVLNILQAYLSTNCVKDTNVLEKTYFFHKSFWANSTV